MQLDVYIPVLDLDDPSKSVMLPGVPYGAGIIGVPDGEELALFVHARENHTHTWADQLHIAATPHLAGETAPMKVPARLMRHVAVYDPRDGTVIVDSSWHARTLVRTWLGTKRRHLSEEVYTTAFPEHPARRVILSCVRDGGSVPAGVQAFANRHGHTDLVNNGDAPEINSPQAAPLGRAPEAEDGITVLSREETERFLLGLAISDHNVECVEIRGTRANPMHYRIRYGDGVVGPWRHIVKRASDAERAARIKRERPDPEPVGTTKSKGARISSLRRMR